MAEMVAEQGYTATTISDVVRRAGVARKSLYDGFDGKEGLFLATFDAAVEEALRRIEQRCAEAEKDWNSQVQAALAAFLGYVAEEPALARACIVEAPTASPMLSAHYEQAMSRFVELLAGIAPHDERLSETIDEALVGGVAWVVHRQLRSGEAEQVLDLLPELSEFVLSPFSDAPDSAD